MPKYRTVKDRPPALKWDKKSKRYYIRGTHRGKPYRDTLIPTYPDDHDLALELYKRKLSKLRYGRTAGTDQVTLAECATAFLDQKKQDGISDGSMVTYDNSLTHFLQFLSDDTPLQNITKHHCIDFRNLLQGRHMKPVTVNRIIAIVRQMFEYAIVVQEWVQSNPTRILRGLKTDQTVKAITLAEVHSVLLECRQQERFGWMYPHIVTLINTGMRFRELYNLHWNDIDLHRQLIVIRKTKTRKDRIVTINEALKKVLVQLKKAKTPKATQVFDFNNIKHPPQCQQLFQIPPDLSGEAGWCPASDPPCLPSHLPDPAG